MENINAENDSEFLEIGDEIQKRIKVSEQFKSFLLIIMSSNENIDTEQYKLMTNFSSEQIAYNIYKIMNDDKKILIEVMKLMAKKDLSIDIANNNEFCKEVLF
jgi:hypothetical protein